MQQPARLAELAAAEADPGHGQHVARFQLRHAHFAVAVVGRVGDRPKRLPSLAAVGRADRNVAVVDGAPRRRRIVQRRAGGRLGARIQQGPVGKLDQVARLAAHRVHRLRLAPGAPVVAAPQQVVGHAARLPLLPAGQQRPVLTAAAPALVHQHHQAAVAQPAELRRHPARLMFPHVAMGDGAVPLPGAAPVRGAGGHDVGEQRGMRVGQAVGRHQPLRRVADAGHRVIPAARVRARSGRRIAPVVVGDDELARLRNDAHRLSLRPTGPGRLRSSAGGRGRRSSWRARSRPRPGRCPLGR